MRQRKPYHHGNLREALLKAAIRLIAEVGPAAFTLREVARRAGVSHNAPYRHFRDKDDLLAAVAAQGFRELTQAMLDAAARQSDTLQRLKHSGLAYVTFALRRPEHFTVMFDAPISKPKYVDFRTGSGASLSDARKLRQELSGPGTTAVRRTPSTCAPCVVDGPRHR
jgi:AcrR family transcriptional regulator